MVSDYNSNYAHGPEVEYPDRKRRKSSRKKRKMIILIIIAAIVIAAAVILALSMIPKSEPEQEDLSWFYEQQKQTEIEKQKLADTQSHVYDLSNPSAEITPINTNIDGAEVKLLYNNNLKFSYNPSFEDPYYLKLSNIEPVTKIVLEYSVPDISFKKSVFDGYITKRADDGVLVTIGEKSKEITVTYPDPDAHLGIKVTDEAGNEIFTDGYNMGYDNNKKQTWSMFVGGNYIVEIVGSEITANMKIYET